MAAERKYPLRTQIWVSAACLLDTEKAAAKVITGNAIEMVSRRTEAGKLKAIEAALAAALGMRLTRRAASRPLVHARCE